MSNYKSKLIEHIKNFSGIVLVDPIFDECSDEMTVVIKFDEGQFVERLSPEEVALRNYNSSLRRGRINDTTTMLDFIDKLREEVDELEHEVKTMRKIDGEELADISIVCDSCAIHYGIDLQLEKQNKMLFNELRTD